MNDHRSLSRIVVILRIRVKIIIKRRQGAGQPVRRLAYSSTLWLSNPSHSAR